MMMFLLQLWMASTVVLATVLAVIVVSQAAWRWVAAPSRPRALMVPTVITLPTVTATPAQRTGPQAGQAMQALLDV
ncbi:MAG: hypothetical protein H7323_15620 [Frankiales bacterium]|nr:hypothetical protein [Frankiales bacterium]